MSLLNRDCGQKWCQLMIGGAVVIGCNWSKWQHCPWVWPISFVKDLVFFLDNAWLPSWSCYIDSPRASFALSPPDVDRWRCAHFTFPLLLIVTLMHKCCFEFGCIFIRQTLNIRPDCQNLDWIKIACSIWVPRSPRLKLITVFLGTQSRRCLDLRS